MGDRFRRPEGWREADWEAKARGENPLSAIRTAEGLVDAEPPAFSQELVDAFFARGRKLFQTNLAPLLSRRGGAGPVLEYGCGAGRIMKSVIGSGHPCAGVDISRSRPPEAIGAMLCEHEMIVDAIHAQDPDGAALAMRWHLSQGRKRLMP